jgi:hypothetical protein
MKIALNDSIICIDEEVGRCTHVMVDPAVLRVTHVVVGEGDLLPRPPRPPRPVVEETEQTVVIKTPHLVLEPDQDTAFPRPPRLRVEEDERHATLTVPHLTMAEDKAGVARLVPFDKLVASTPYGIWIDCAPGELAAMDAFVVRKYITVNVPDYHSSVELMVLGGHVLEERRLVAVDERRVPPGEVALNGSTAVEATDGTMGQVGELVVEPESGRITYLRVQEGPPWHQNGLLVPAALIDRISEAAVHLRLDRQGVGALAPVDSDLDLATDASDEKAVA